MIIKYQKEELIKRFCDVKVGQTFLYDNELYLKTTYINNLNAVCLSKNHLSLFSNYTCIFLVEAEVILKDSYVQV